MADNVTLNAGTGGDTLASDDIGGVKFQRVKLIEGADGTNDGDISAANPLPVAPISGQVGVQGGTGTDTALTQRVSLATNIALPAGTANIGTINSLPAHDAAIAGVPVTAGGVAVNMDATAPPNRISAESDSVRQAMDWDGVAFTHPHGPQIWSYHSDGAAALTDAAIAADPGDGLAVYITDIVFSNGAATALNLFFEEGSTKILGPYYLEAVAGRGMALHFQTPKKVSASTALTATTSAANAQSLDVTGFIAQG